MSVSRLTKEMLEPLALVLLKELAKGLGVEKVSALSKDAVIQAIVRTVTDAEDLLSLLQRDELKAICAGLGLDPSGREKQAIIDRILAATGSKVKEKAGEYSATGARSDTPLAPLSREEMEKVRSREVEEQGRRKSGKRPIEQYGFQEASRLNNPPVGLVKPENDPDVGKKIYQYDPHLDPSLQWAGKAERTSFEIPTVSLHVHERIDPRSIIEAVRKKNGSNYEQLSMFNAPKENPPLREAIDFYKHPHGWSNRLIAGDSLLVMNSLLEKEGMAGKIQMVYFDPPYGIKYGSNFQPFVNKRDVKDGKDEDLTQEPEMIKAFRDTWELGIHSYLSYLRDRLLLARDLLSESGSIFVQISDENVHHVRELMDEVFGGANFCSLITVQKTSARSAELLAGISDYIIWYGKSKEKIKFRPLFTERPITQEVLDQYRYLENRDGTRLQLPSQDVERSKLLEGKLFRPVLLTSSHEYSLGKEPFLFEGRKYLPGTRYWSTSPSGLKNLGLAGRLFPTGNTLNFLRYLNDFPFIPIADIWTDTSTGGGSERYYVVQTTIKVISRCLLISTDPGDLVLDITCGSGTTAVAAEQWGRRWITCDTSRIAITLAKQRLMTSVFDYYQLQRPEVGLSGSLEYRTVPHVTLKSIANNPEIREGMTRAQIEAAIKKYADQETLYDQPIVDNSKVRVTGPFTVEAVPAPMVHPLHEIPEELPADATAARSGETLRQNEWRSELSKSGIRGKGGNVISFSRVEALPGTRWLSAEGETRDGERVVFSFGPQHAPMEPRQVASALDEAENLRPKPKMIVFAAFQFDPEAAKDIDQTNWPGVNLLKAQMNTDLLTDDLKKKRTGDQAFWLVGQPDVRMNRIQKGEQKGWWQVSVHGFDYYNPKTGEMESGGKGKIAMWLLDTDYDGRSLLPRQVFFPMAGEKDGWARLARNLKAEIDEERIEAYRGTESLPFETGKHCKVAVKIVDDRGIESLRVLGLEG